MSDDWRSRVPRYRVFDRGSSSRISRDLERELTALKDHHVRYGATSYDRSYPMLRPRTASDISITPQDFAFHFRRMRSDVEARIDTFTYRTSGAIINTGIPADFIETPYISPEDLRMWQTNFSPDIKKIADWYRWGFTPGRAALWRAVGTGIPVNAVRHELEGRPAIMGPFIAAVGSGDGSNMGTYLGIMASFVEPQPEYDVYELMVRMNGWYAERVVTTLVPGLSTEYLDAANVYRVHDLRYVVTAFRSGYPAE